MLNVIGLGVLLVLAQALAGVPWVLFLGGDRLVSWWRQLPGVRRLSWTGGLLGGLVLAGALLGYVLYNGGDREALVAWGRIYSSFLQLQLTVDVFVLAFLILLLAWPKGAAVAVAAFREGVRQPMFWLLLLAGVVFMFFAILLPYFTFGEDLAMMTEIDYDIIMSLAVVFAVFTASISISDEIEGRTAITLMSKPLSRRQFLLGKYAGILLASLMMTLLLTWCFNWMVMGKRWFESYDAIEKPEVPPAALVNFLNDYCPVGDVQHFMRGAGLWLFKSLELAPGVLLGFGQVMILLAIAVALATRLPMIVNVPICVAIYFLGHLTPLLKDIASNFQRTQGQGSPVAQMLTFMAQLFDNLLPSLEFFTANYAALLGRITFYGVLYTIIILLFGLILFEDRDLA